MVEAYPIRNGRLILYPERLFGKSQPVGRWATSVATKAQAAVKREAPVRTGRLAGSVRAWSARSAPTEVMIRLNVEVYYAGFVLYGTEPYVNDVRMPIGKSQGAAGRRTRPGGYGKPTYTYAFYRAGQDANDFVGRGMERVASRHPSIGRGEWMDLSEPWQR